MNRGAPGTPAASSERAELALAGQRLVLLPERALWLPELATLLVADVHIGKAASFRRLGTPVPEATTAGTLERLTRALRQTQARRLCVLGDLMHSRAAHASAPDAHFSAWREAHREIALLLVEGNHDQRAGPPPPGWHVQVMAEPFELCAGLALAHHPQPHPSAYVLAGHLHPAAVLASRGPGALRLPCFHFGPRCGVLPAFGEFTGSHVVRAQPGERLFVVGAGAVREVPVAGAGLRGEAA